MGGPAGPTDMKPNIKLKRVYEARERSDGTRVLVERLWPRGVRKDSGAVDVWMKQIAPSPELRKWFAHDPEKWSEFCRRYRAELKANPAAVAELLSLVGQGGATFVYAAKDEQRNSAVLLRDYLSERGWW